MKGDEELLSNNKYLQRCRIIMKYIPVLYPPSDEKVLRSSIPLHGRLYSREEALSLGKNERRVYGNLPLALYLVGVENGKVQSLEKIENLNDKNQDREDNPMGDSKKAEQWLQLEAVRKARRASPSQVADAMIVAYDVAEMLEADGDDTAGRLAEGISEQFYAKSPNLKRSKQLVGDVATQLANYLSEGISQDEIKLYDKEDSIVVCAPMDAEWIEPAIAIGGDFNGGVWTFPKGQKDEVMQALRQMTGYASQSPAGESPLGEGGDEEELSFESEGGESEAVEAESEGETEREENPAKGSSPAVDTKFGKEVFSLAKKKKVDKYDAVVSVIASSGMDRSTAQKAVRDATEPPPKKELTPAQKKEQKQKKVERELKKLEPYLEKVSAKSRKVIEAQIKKNIEEDVPCIPMPEGESVAEKEMEKAVSVVEEDDKDDSKAKEEEAKKAKARHKERVSEHKAEKEKALAEAKKAREDAKKAAAERHKARLSEHKAERDKAKAKKFEYIVTPRLNKVGSLEEYLPQLRWPKDYHEDRAEVIKTVKPSLNRYLEITSNFMNEEPEFQGEHGTGTTADIPDVPWQKLTDEQKEQFRKHSYAIVTKVIPPKDSLPVFYVDNQGHKYARYVMFPREYATSNKWYSYLKAWWKEIGGDVDYQSLKEREKIKEQMEESAKVNESAKAKEKPSDDKVALFNSLKKGDKVTVAATYVMSSGGMFDGKPHSWEVHRKYTSKKKGYSTVTLTPDGKKPRNEATTFKLWKKKSKDGGYYISGSLGDMAVTIKSVSLETKSKPPKQEKTPSNVVPFPTPAPAPAPPKPKKITVDDLEDVSTWYEKKGMTDYVVVDSPYNKEFVSWARANYGEWDGRNKVWKFKDNKRGTTTKEVEKALIRIYAPEEEEEAPQPPPKQETKTMSKEEEKITLSAEEQKAFQDSITAATMQAVKELKKKKKRKKNPQLSMFH